MPDIPLTNGSLYRPGNCWIDMYNSICNAQSFIYICGASCHVSHMAHVDQLGLNCYLVCYLNGAPN